MSKPLIVSYYTDDEKYSTLAAALMLRLNVLNYEYHIYKKPSVGNWAKKASYKPSVILEAMREHPGRDVIWMDIDAVPRFLPELMLESRYDFVVGSYYPWWLLANLVKFSGTSDSVKFMLRLWEHNTPIYLHHTDELLLTHAWYLAMCMGKPLRYAILNKLQVAGVSQLNVSDRKDSPRMFHQQHLSERFKSMVTKRKFDVALSLDEILVAV